MRERIRLQYKLAIKLIMMDLKESDGIVNRADSKM